MNFVRWRIRPRTRRHGVGFVDYGAVCGIVGESIGVESLEGKGSIFTVRILGRLKH